MATRYYVNKDAQILFCSENPAEHKAIKALGFEAFSPWYAIQFEDHYRKHNLPNGNLPEGFTMAHMRQLTEMGKAGNFGTYSVKSAHALEYTGHRAAKVGRGVFDFVPAAK